MKKNQTSILLGRYTETPSFQKTSAGLVTASWLINPPRVKDKSEKQNTFYRLLLTFVFKDQASAGHQGHHKGTGEGARI